jgi:hypothetical protein
MLYPLGPAVGIAAAEAPDVLCTTSAPLFWMSGPQTRAKRVMRESSGKEGTGMHVRAWSYPRAMVPSDPRNTVCW